MGRGSFETAVMVATAFAGTALPGPVLAQSPEDAAPIAVSFAARANMATVSFDVSQSFTEKFRRRLVGGLTSQVLITIKLEDASGVTVATEARTCKLRLDIWDDVLYVRITDAGRVRRKTLLLVDEALKSCGQLESVPLVDRTLLTRANGYRMFARVDLNPVSPELLERTREFTSNPRGTSSGRPPSFFSAVAELFRGNVDAGGETFFFASGSLRRPSARSSK